jgi:hypothetical protein
MRPFKTATIVFYAPLYVAFIMTTALLSALLSACAAPEPLVENHHGQVEHAVIGQKQQLMIKFTAPLSESQVKQKLLAMSAAYQVSFRLLRPMSGGAYVITVQGAGDTQQLSRLLAQIDKRPDIIYIEQDRMMRHFQQTTTVPIY